MKKTLLSAFILFISLAAFSQTDSTKKDSTKIAFMVQADFEPKIFPPSPNAAQLGRYGEVPVSLTNGTVSYSIPIYEVESGGLKVPITLDYQGSGLKVNDMSSPIGSGWSLNAGGVITRSVRGNADEDAFGYLNHDYPQPILPLSDLCYKSEASINRKDPQPDLWYYNFIGYSGSYIYSRPYDVNTGNFLANQTPVPIMFPHETTLKVTNDGNLKQITDNTGTVYTFAVEETTINSSTVWSSAYYLSKIKNQLGDEITFSYIDVTYVEGVYSRILRTQQTQPNTLTNISHEQNFNSTTYLQKQLSDIYFRNGKIHFLYVNDRLDTPNSGRLDAIIIYKKVSSSNYAEIKRYKLNQDYFQCNNESSRTDFNPSNFSHAPSSPLLKRLRFNSLEEIPVVGVPQNSKYCFDYYNDFSLPIHYSMSQDYWGYYNGIINSRNLLIWDTYSLNNLPNTTEGANRNSDINYAVLGSLKSITYPTKGKSVFIYELNRGPDNKAAGGLRIKSITSIDNSGNKISEKNYNYTKPYYVSNVYEGNLNNLVLNTSLEFYSPPEPCTGNIITEVVYAEEVGLVLGGSSSVAYEEVEEYLVDYDNTANRLGKSFYKFAAFQDYDARPIPNQYINYGYKRGQLLEKWNYQLIANIETCISKEINTYQAIPLPFRASQLSIYQQFRYPKAETLPSCPLSDPICATLPEGIVEGDIFSEEFLHQEAESILIVTSEKINYDDNGINPVSTKVSHEFADFPYTQASKTTITNSDNKVYESINSYPYHFATLPYTEMVTNHIIAPNIETVEKSDNAQQYKIINNYQKLSSGIFVMATVQTQLKSSDPLHTEITFNSYNTYGNPLSWVYKGVTTDLTYYSDTDYGKAYLLKEKIVNAQTTLYDYEPLFGLKKITLPNNIISHFEYDGIGRLLNVKDHNNNLVDQYAYQYATTLPPTCISPAAPIISVALATLCNAILTAPSCVGTVDWSNGATGSSVTVLSNTSTIYTATCTANACTSPVSNSLSVPTLPSGWVSGDVGPFNGCTMSGNPGQLSLQGSGVVGDLNDSFHWTYKAMTGDFTMIAKINDLSMANGQRSGIMIRSNTGTDAQFYTLIQDANANVGEIKRDANGGTGALYSYAPSAVNQTWIKVVKTGTSIKGYHSTNSDPELNNAWDENFILTGNAPTTLNFGTNFLVGLVAYGASNQTTFTNITLNGNAF